MNTRDPKAFRQDLVDLHRHLDGSLRRSTLEAFSEADGVAVPDDFAFHTGMGLDEALARFAFTLARLSTPDRVAQVAAEICEDAAEEGVSTLEIRFAPQLHRGATTAEILDAALDGVGGRAGVLLCGLYGDPPARLEALVDLAIEHDGVVGIDLAGGPAEGDSHRLVDYRPAFRRAGRAGLGTTVHAGEGRPPAEIRDAIEFLGAARIGHGTTLLDDPSVLDLVIERGVTIEACVTSNLHVGAIDSIEDHPIARWLQAGVKVCICTDNTLLSGVDAPTEYGRVLQLPGMSDELLARATHHGHAGAFRR
jgi:adenosine deaminase